MGGEQGKSPYLVCQVDGAGPGQGQAVVGAGAAAYLVYQYQTPVRSVVQDHRGFHHLGHKGGFPGGRISSARADAGEDAVNRTKDCLVGGDKNCRYAPAA